MRGNTIVGLAVAGLALLASATAAFGQTYGQTQNAGKGAENPYVPSARTPESPALPTMSAGPIADYRRGVTEFKAGKYQDAVKSFNRALAIAPTDSNTWTMLGLSKEGVGDVSGAHDAYAKAVAYNGGNTAARQRLGETAAWLGQMDEAQAQLAALQQRAAACGDCTDSARLKTAIGAVQDAIVAGPGGGAAPPKG